ncbi:MAG: 50S ribosomal protein L18 [Chloroflexi bacterium]|nr:50S ribosomal protein L18 [Chloroflexota bacterium]
MGGMRQKRRKTPQAQRMRRHLRIRKKVSGTPNRPRLAVYRSLANIYAQVIDDEAGRTLAHASSVETALKGAEGKKSEIAEKVGALIGERAKAAGVERVVFDRGGNLYHGRIKALADAARKAGLDF